MHFTVKGYFSSVGCLGLSYLTWPSTALKSWFVHLPYRVRVLVRMVGTACFMCYMFSLVPYLPTFRVRPRNNRTLMAGRRIIYGKKLCFLLYTIRTVQYVGIHAKQGRRRRDIVPCFFRRKICGRRRRRARDLAG